jgi:hypothetical protein
MNYQVWYLEGEEGQLAKLLEDALNTLNVDDEVVAITPVGAAVGETLGLIVTIKKWNP